MGKVYYIEGGLLQQQEICIQKTFIQVQQIVQKEQSL